MFKELKEIIYKELKEIMRMVSHQIKNVNKELEVIKKKRKQTEILEQKKHSNRNEKLTRVVQQQMQAGKNEVKYDREYRRSSNFKTRW